jgi:hypothetical protein
MGGRGLSIAAIVSYPIEHRYNTSIVISNTLIRIYNFLKAYSIKSILDQFS